jgi:ferredoxin
MASQVLARIVTKVSRTASISVRVALHDGAPLRGLCAQTAPRSLRMDADGLAEAVAETVNDEYVVEAALVCPIGAIAIREVNDSQV